MVASWLLVQGASIVFPTFGAPGWALKVFIVAAIAFFPFVIWIVWVATPEPDVQNLHAAGQWTRGDFILVSLLGAILLISVIELAMPYRATSPDTHPPATTGAGQASIAVLPFENLSSDKDTGYFAAGIQDEILTRLARIGALKVISRTSTQQFASRPENLSKIARQLGVANILEGSVQKSGDQVRVNVQLIRAASDTHIWAEIYDRKLTDVFAVESDVASEVAAALAAKITPGERAAISAAPTASPQAHDDYLRGLVASRQNTPIGMNRAIDYLTKAVAADPNYVQTWALLSRVNAYYYFSDGPTKTRDAALSALAQARSLDARSIDVGLAQGFYLYYVDRDYQAALQQFERVHSTLPNDAEVLSALGMISRRVGAWQQSRLYFEQAIKIDPLTDYWRSGLLSVLLATHDYRTAAKIIDEVLRRRPNDQAMLGSRIAISLETGKLDQASAAFSALVPDPVGFELVEPKLYYLKVAHRFKEGVAYAKTRIAAAEAAQSYPVDDMLRLIAYLGQFQERAGDTAAAQATYRHLVALCDAKSKLNPDHPVPPEVEALAYTGLGERARAEAAADRAVMLRPTSKDSIEGLEYEETQVRVAARFNDRARAIPMLTRMLTLPSYLSPALLRLDPDFDALRSDPRFQKLENQAVKVYR